MNGSSGASPSLIDRVIRFCLENKLVVLLIVLFVVGWGTYVMPFPHGIEGLEQDPIPVDAFPDIGENQQIVFTDWPGRSPEDVENQVTYPLVTSLQGIPGVKTIRAISMFGFSSVFIIFEDGIDFYWSRSRVLERLNVAQQRLPEGLVPFLGPDATGLGQVFWYTVEGEGFDLQELRSIQDWFIRYALQSAGGVSEVASIGGYVKEYQVDVDPDAMRAHGVMLGEILMAVERGNIDVGAETIDWNGVEYTIRGVGYIQSPEDVEQIVIKVTDGVPIRVQHVAHVSLGPALRRGILDRDGVEATGGVVLCRYGENPLQTIENVRARIENIAPSLPRRTLPDGRVSQVHIVPYYDRTQLIYETLDTLKAALIEEVIITIFTVLIFAGHFRASILISLNLPIAVMVSFILMWAFGVDSNLMSLGGIAIAIGTMVDMGIILTENMIRHLDEAKPGEDPLEVIYRAASEVGSAVATAVATTVIGFLPIFALEGPEGKLFKPLAYTKTFALMASVVVALTVLPAVAHLMLPRREFTATKRAVGGAAVILLGGFFAQWLGLYSPLLLSAYGFYLIVERFWIPTRVREVYMPYVASAVGIGVVLYFLTIHWMPLGLDNGLGQNLIFVFGINIVWTVLRLIFIRWYPQILRFFLDNKPPFLAVVTGIVLFGIVIWVGFQRTFSLIPFVAERAGVDPGVVRSTTLWMRGSHEFPGLGREFMPPLDEGSYLLMPTTMPHTSVGEALGILQAQDRAIRAIPEVESVVGKVGRAESAIDPAPISMVETVITYRPEYGPPDPVTGERQRQWRDHIRTPSDIWDEIVAAAQVPGSTSAPRLQPIAARLVMLQTGMRAPMGIKVRGHNLEDIEAVGYRVAELLRQVPGVNPDAVIPDRVIARPYIEIEIDRERIARYGVNIRDVQDVIEVAIGGMRATTTVEGRERYPVRIRYLRELRDSPDDLERILVPGAMGAQIPLSQLADIRFVPGPQEIKSEDTFLVSYVLFDKLEGSTEVEVVEAAKRYIDSQIESGALDLRGTELVYAGTYEAQVRFQQRLTIILPTTLFIIFLIIYFQFRSVSTTILVSSGLFVCVSGGFIGIWLIGQPWFMNFTVFGESFRTLFNMRTYSLSVAVWVGFIALCGVATDDGVVISTYLDQVFGRTRVGSVEDIRKAVVIGGMRRVRPCLMTTTTTVLALLPVMTSTGRGSDVMIPMAIPIFYGMTIELITIFCVPVLYCLAKEVWWKLGWTKGAFTDDPNAPTVDETFREAQALFGAGFAGAAKRQDAAAPGAGAGAVEAAGGGEPTGPAGGS